VSNVIEVLVHAIYFSPNLGISTTIISIFHSGEYALKEYTEVKQVIYFCSNGFSIISVFIVPYKTCIKIFYREKCCLNFLLELLKGIKSFLLLY